jgi:hypothetical protein
MDRTLHREDTVRLPALWGLAVALAAAAPSQAAPQAAPQASRTGLEFGGVPAINFDSDEGFGYGAVVELYQYGDGSAAPYLWTLQPTVFLTSEGRRDFTVFFDAPHALPGGWRLDAYLGSEKQIATPYYGLGNASAYDAEAVTDGNPYFFRFGRTRRAGTLNLQRPLGGGPLRVLVGVGVTHGSVVTVPNGEGTTLLAREVAASEVRLRDGWANYARAGLIWDTRDRETGPRRGTWTEILVQRVDEALGSATSYTRWTVADRRYFSAGPLTLAHRVLLQGASDELPVHDLHRVQSSFKQQEGLGGAKSVRGVLKNRFAGRGMMLWNTELRYRALDFGLLGRSFHLVLSGYADAGRVWRESVRLTELFADLHRGYGGGVRVGMGDNFTVAVDAGTSSETGLQLYIGLGYLY